MLIRRLLTSARVFQRGIEIQNTYKMTKSDIIIRDPSQYNYWCLKYSYPDTKTTVTIGLYTHDSTTCLPSCCERGEECNLKEHLVRILLVYVLAVPVLRSTN